MYKKSPIYEIEEFVLHMSLGLYGGLFRKDKPSLMAMAKNIGVNGRSRMTKAELRDVIYAWHTTPPKIEALQEAGVMLIFEDSAAAKPGLAA